jgi:hypothetical protein
MASLQPDRLPLDSAGGARTPASRLRERDQLVVHLRVVVVGVLRYG